MSSKYFYYTDENNKTVFRVHYVYNPQGSGYCYIQHQNKDEAWVKGTGGRLKYPLYHLPQVLKSETVFLVNNEEEAEHLNDLKLTATTTPGNLKSWKKEYTHYLSLKNVIILLHNPSPELRDRYKKYAQWLLNGIEDGFLRTAKSVKLVELPCPICYISLKGDVGSESTRLSVENLKALINKSYALDISDITFEEKKTLIDIKEETETIINQLEFGDSDTYINTLAEISSYPTVALRTHLLKKVAIRMNVMLPDVEKDFKTYFGSIEPKETLYFYGLVDIADYIGKPCFVIAENMNLTAKHFTHYNNQTYRVPENIPSSIGTCFFQFIEENYKTAISQLPYDFSRSPYAPTKYDKELFADTKNFIGSMAKFDDEIIDLIAYFVLMTYVHDTEDIKSLPFLYLLFPSNKAMEEFNHIAFSELTFRGVIQNYLRGYHIEKLSTTLGATCHFIISDFEKSLHRNNLYDVFRERHKKYEGARYKTSYVEFKENFDEQNLFTPTIISTIKPLKDDLLASISLCIPVSSVSHVRAIDMQLKTRLTAWRGVMMDIGLENVSDTGLPEVMKPLIQICSMVNPEGKETLIKTIKTMMPEDKTTENKQGQSIAEVLLDQFPKHDAEVHDFGTVADVTAIVNKFTMSNLSATVVGRVLNGELKLKTIKAHPGGMRLVVSQQDMKRLKKRYDINIPVVQEFDKSVHKMKQAMKRQIK